MSGILYLNRRALSRLAIILLVTLTIPVFAFEPDEWTTRCWDFDEKRWAEQDGKTMTLTKSEGATLVTNETGIHRHAHFVLKSPLQEDFVFTIEVKGGYELGWVNRDGKDEMLYVEIDEKTSEFVTYELRREGTRFTITRNGRVVPLVHFRFDYGDEVQIALALKEGESASIRKCLLE
ncbi:MAG: hypothetical protein CMO55_23245 [Verrucomicrobiales bacterium]|nr:hypothetical protein [Verrucomicrobiales bacterium]